MVLAPVHHLRQGGGGAGRSSVETVMERVCKADTIAAAVAAPPLRLSVPRTGPRFSACSLPNFAPTTQRSDRAARPILIAPVYLRLDTPIPIQTQTSGALESRDHPLNAYVKYY